MPEQPREFSLDDLNLRSTPLRQRLLEQGEVGLSHPVDILEVINNSEFDFLKINGYDPAHDRWHIRRVFTNAETIAATEAGDIEVVWAIAAFHDLITYKKGTKEQPNPLHEQETEETAEYLDAWLKEINFPAEKLAAVKQGIKESSFYKTYLTKPLKRVRATSKEAEIGFDADKLDQGGALGLIRFSASSGRIGRLLFNHDDPGCDSREPDPDKYGLDLAKERSVELEKLLYTESGKNIAKRRGGFLQKFFIQLKEELKKDEVGEAQEIMKIFENSGKQGMQFYHEQDPFRDFTLPDGNKRKLEPKKYSFDALLENAGGQEFIREFLEELRLELEGK